MRRYHITVGATTTVDGTVKTGYPYRDINGQLMAREGDDVYCPECDSTGTIFCDGPRLSEYMDDRRAALEGDLCHCKCDPSPRLIAVQTLVCQEIETPKVAPPQRTAAPPAPPATPAAQHPPAVEARPANFTPTPSRPVSSYSELPGHACENLWRGYQQRVENVVAPGGKLITDPKARNKAINAAYAQLWRHDQRFQWAGLAAFASKQVGCGLLHAAESVEKMQAESEAMQQLRDSSRKGLAGLISPSEREKRAAIREFEQRQRDYEQANRDNPVWGFTHWGVDSALPLAQQMYRFVHEMLAMGNTTLFLDVYPLHVFYAERGLEALKACLDSRKNIYGTGEYPVLWPVGQETLRFGIDHDEILLAFEAIDAGNIAESVALLAEHEQVNILQPAMYDHSGMKWMMRGNHLSYVTDVPSGAAQAIELTLASQCRPVEDERTIGFSNFPFADLADAKSRMAFVLKAAAQFDDLLQSDQRDRIAQSIREIALGGGVR
ncbi:PAAR domain-containing protein [Pseudomonas sp. PDM31]|uniref:PAAR domain-containing protein n=1 Tax=Pseudomonas sp. PDM31 TaxID=2854778 RepID=UPI001C480BAA|nr:PAAR domain-containing protein [Pseudomonas sp. PDM31]MBV7478278.1 PAAR domain-containing protein [Pseudomonas sp. PDM31]